MTEYRWINDEYKKIPSSESNRIDAIMSLREYGLVSVNYDRAMGLTSWSIGGDSEESFTPTKCSSCGRKLTDGECIKGCGATQ